MMERDPLTAIKSGTDVIGNRGIDGGGDGDGDGDDDGRNTGALSSVGDESSPLLRAEGSGGADIDDFAGLPWYRKPSVRYPLRIISRLRD